VTQSAGIGRPSSSGLRSDAQDSGVGSCIHPRVAAEAVSVKGSRCDLAACDSLRGSGVCRQARPADPGNLVGRGCYLSQQARIVGGRPKTAMPKVPRSSVGAHAGGRPGTNAQHLGVLGDAGIRRGTGVMGSPSPIVDPGDRGRIQVHPMIG
jgi:hypothetical protein